VRGCQSRKHFLRAELFKEFPALAKSLNRKHLRQLWDVARLDEGDVIRILENLALPIPAEDLAQIVRLAQSQAEPVGLPGTHEEFLIRVTKSLPAFIEKKLALGARLYSLNKKEGIVLIKSLLKDLPVVRIDLNKALIEYQQKEVAYHSQALEDITESYLTIARQNSLPIPPIQTPILKVILLDDLLGSYTRKGRKHALENLLIHWDSQITKETFVLKTKHQKQLLGLIDKLRLKNKHKFLTHIPQDLKHLDKIYLGTTRAIKALKEQNIKAITLKKSQYPVLASSFLNSLMNNIALKDYTNAHSLFKTHTQHKTITLTQFKKLIQADPEMLDLYPIEPILAKSLQEAIKLYQLTRTSRISA